MDVKRMESRFGDIYAVLPSNIRPLLESLPAETREGIYEIRLRTNAPLAFTGKDGVSYPDRSGTLHIRPADDSPVMTKQDVMECFQLVCGYSVYSHQSEIKNGFVTIRSGHRVGLAGTAITDKSGITGVRDISSVNIRIAREVRGIAKPILQKLFREQEYIHGFLIAGAPSSGKTTLLRDLAKQLSDGALGASLRVCVVDERGEIGAVYGGKPGNDLGVSCDILDNYPKGEGILIALRCFSPDVILCDEMGTEEEVQAVLAGLNAGVPLITSVHAHSIEELLSRPQARALIQTGAFEDIVLLKSAKEPGQVSGYYKVRDIYDD